MEQLYDKRKSLRKNNYGSESVKVVLEGARSQSHPDAREEEPLL